jgi:hypothetical protein
MDAGLQLRIRIRPALGRLGALLVADERVERVDYLAGGRAVLAVKAVVEAHG